ncbi:hypothetical protein [Terrisporobacter muris]|uniref:Uncharacterized protein n=1 Tax=Terrisporobacter muris TaxID=2963284 RepID=A0A9X2M9L4_9FIRM|nr:hypothetical protein [Terrisporobacter muris]MCR1821890.1 hypothetical protein [Terrisporobacter muris]
MDFSNVYIGDMVKVKVVGAKNFVIGEVVKISEGKITISNNYFDDLNIDIVLCLIKI